MFFYFLLFYFFVDFLNVNFNIISCFKFQLYFCQMAHIIAKHSIYYTLYVKLDATGKSFNAVPLFSTVYFPALSRAADNVTLGLATDLSKMFFKRFIFIFFNFRVLFFNTWHHRNTLLLVFVYLL